MSFTFTAFVFAYLYFPCSIYEVNSIQIVFLHACCYGKDVWVKDNVTWIKSQLLNQQIVGSGADFDFPVTFCCLMKDENALYYNLQLSCCYDNKDLWEIIVPLLQ